MLKKDKTYYLIVFKRFLKGFLSAIGAFTLQYLMQQLPILEHSLPSIVNSPALLMVLSAGILSLEKALQGYQPQLAGK